MSSTTEQVKASKEEKRKKLEELRARKKLREEQLLRKQDSKTGKTAPVSGLSLSQMMNNIQKAEVPIKPASINNSPERTNRTKQNLSKSDLLLSISFPPRQRPEVEEAEVQAGEDPYLSGKNNVQQIDDAQDKIRHVQRQPDKEGEAAQKENEERQQEDDEQIYILPPEEVQQIILSEEFNQFIKNAVVLIDDALNEEFDVTTDFLNLQSNDDLYEKNNKFKHIETYTEENICVRGIKWSPHNNNHFLSYYVTQNLYETYDPIGIIRLWDLNKKTSIALRCQSPVMNAQYIKSDPNLIIGGSFSGQIMGWDVRAQSYPSIRSALELQDGFSFPVQHVQQLQESGNLISINNEGKVCIWTLQMLHQPILQIELKTRTREIAVSSFAMRPNNDSDFFVGNEDGNIHFSQIMENSYHEPNVVTQNFHQGPITSLNFQTGDNGLMLATSADWTASLISFQNQEPVKQEIEGYQDYIYDSAWSPINPNLFCLCDGDGNLDLWDLAKGLESYDIRLQLGNHALNALGWDYSGLNIMAGNSQGDVMLCNLDQEKANLDSWSKFKGQ